MSFKGLPCNPDEAGIFLVFLLFLDIITEGTLSLLDVLTLSHMTILFKQSKRSPAGSGLRAPQCDYKTSKMGWGAVRDWAFALCPVSCVTIMILNYPLSKNHQLTEVHEKGCGFMRNSRYN